MATRSAIAQLRSKLEGMEDNDQLIQDDLYLALWLNLNNSDLRKSEASVRDAVTWWNANAVSLAQESIPPAFSNKLPVYYDETGRDGLPVSYIRMTSLDLHGLVSQFKTSDAIRCTLQMVVNAQSRVRETYPLLCDTLGDEALKSARGHVAIVDACDLSRRHLPPIKAINLFMQAYREGIRVPSCPRAIYVIGVGTLLRAIGKPLIPIFQGFGVTLRMYGTDEKTWEADLCQIIDKKMLEELRDRASMPANKEVTCDKTNSASRWLSSDLIAG